jgi:hypothetical protein
MKGTVRLREVYETYRDRVEFLMIYIREAHPTDGRVVPVRPFGFRPKRFGEAIGQLLA